MCIIAREVTTMVSWELQVGECCLLGGLAHGESVTNGTSPSRVTVRLNDSRQSAPFVIGE